MGGGLCADFSPPCGTASCCTPDDNGTPADPADDTVVCTDPLQSDCVSGGGLPFPGDACNDATFTCPGPAQCINGTGDCFATHGGLGCERIDCCSAVCAAMPSCCQVEWNAACAAEVTNYCIQNDDCPDALPIVTGTTPFDTTDATTDGPPDCPGDTNVGKQDIWFVHTATCNGDLTLSTPF